MEWKRHVRWHLHRYLGEPFSNYSEQSEAGSRSGQSDALNRIATQMSWISFQVATVYVFCLFYINIQIYDQQFEFYIFCDFSIWRSLVLPRARREQREGHAEGCGVQPNVTRIAECWNSGGGRCTPYPLQSTSRRLKLHIDFCFKSGVFQKERWNAI